MAGEVVVTMAGFGTRFKNAGYTVPKYQIEVHGRTLVSWSLLSLQPRFTNSKPASKRAKRLVADLNRRSFPCAEAGCEAKQTAASRLSS